MSYKIYNELPKMRTDVKALISVIYYNVYNVTKEAPGAGAKIHGCDPPHLAPSRHQGRAQMAHGA